MEAGPVAMTWNYRVVRREYEMPDGETEVKYAIHEAYYGEGHGAAADSITEDAVSFQAENLDGLTEVLEWAGFALNKPVLKYEDF